MNNLILQLRKALVHYEECVDVCAAEHIMIYALMALNQKCREVAFECDKQIEAMLKED
jgi:hypothetical protein